MKEMVVVVSDEEIARGVEMILLNHQNAPVSSLNDVVLLLSSKLGIDLSHKAAFILDQIRHYQPPPPPPVVSNNHFLIPLQLQTQQHQRFHPQFSHHFPGFHPHAPTHYPYAPPQFVNQQVAPSHVTPPQFKDVSPTVKVSNKESTQTGAKRRGGAGGLNKLCGVSPELQAVVGESAMARTEIVKQLWAYIRKNNLQDPSNKRKIICDETLRAVFEIDCTDMFKMNKLLSKHILPLDPSKNSVQSKRQKVDIEVTAEPTQGISPVIISDALALFLGATNKEMLASEATQRVLEYIKANSLEDPSSMTVICDEKLRELLNCESIPAVGIDDMLARQHLFQSS